MFTRKTKKLTVDGVEMILTELTKKKAHEVKAAMEANEEAGTSKAFVEMVRKTDGSAFFGSDADVDELPLHVMQEIGDAIKAFTESLNAPKN